VIFLLYGMPLEYWAIGVAFLAGVVVGILLMKKYYGNTLDSI